MKTPSPEEWMEAWHKQVGPKYRDGKGVAACGLIAMAAAKVLDGAGEPWELKMVHTKDWQKGLRPEPYPELEWGGHVVCLSNGKVFDPIFPEPVELETYLGKLFPRQETTLRSLKNELPKELEILPSKVGKPTRKIGDHEITR